MELKTYKYIKNNKSLPGFNPGTDGNNDSWFKRTFTQDNINKGLTIGANAINTFGAIQNTFSPAKNQYELMKDAGTSNMNVGGINTQINNGINQDTEMQQLNAENKAATLGAAQSGAKLGSSVGSLLGPVGGLVGGAIGGIGGFVSGLFGGASRRRKLKEAIKNANIATTYKNQSIIDDAGTQMLQQEDAAENGYACGKDSKNIMTRYNNGKAGNVWSPVGQINGPVNSKVGFGESIVNLHNGTGTVVTKGKRGVDNQPSTVQEDDDNTIFGNLYNPYTGNTFADDALMDTAKLQRINDIEKKTKDYGKLSSLSKQTQEFQKKQFDVAKQPMLNNLSRLAEQQKQVHNIQNRYTYNYGKPGFDPGTDDNNPYTFNMFDYRYPNMPKYVTDWGNYKGSLTPGNTQRAYVTDTNMNALKEEQTPGYDTFRAGLNQYLNRPMDKTIFDVIQSNRIPTSSAYNNATYALGSWDEKGGIKHTTPDLLRDYVQGPFGNTKYVKPDTLEWLNLKTQYNNPFQIRNGYFVNNLYNPLNRKSVEQSQGEPDPKQPVKQVNPVIKGNPASNDIGDYYTVPTIANMLTAYDQYNRANQPIKGSDVFAPNKYEGLGLRGLAGLSLNPNNYARPIYDAERRGLYNINQSGGMSGGQRQLSRLALALGTQQNMTNMLRDVYEKNLGYKNNYYTQALNIGEQNAQRRQSANQYDFDTYTKAHAAREQMRQMAQRNMLSALWNYNANAFKRDISNKTLNLYNTQLSNEQKRILAELNKSK